MINSYKNKLERGVSPVVGVILMVAVTVILAAVIGTFVLDLGGSVSQSAQAGVSFDQSGDTVDVQLTTVQTGDSIWVEASSTDDGASAITDSSPANGYDDGGGVDTTINNEVGPDNDDQYLLTSSGDGGPGTIVTVASSSGEQVSVIGEVDGSESVIQTYTLE